MTAIKMLKISCFFGTIITSLGYTEGYYRIVNEESLQNANLELLAALPSREKREAGFFGPTTEQPSQKEIFKYYEARYLAGQEATQNWVDLDVMEGGSKKTHATLSGSHRTASMVTLSFTFKFYGHKVQTVTIATGGFLYMSDFLHQWLSATQYVAPLMANFDPSLDNHSNIHYVDNTTHFAVQWDKVLLHKNIFAGPFTFQVVLRKGGQILFNYKEIPIPVDEIKEDEHPVKVGLSDAYYMDHAGDNNITRRTIYEYDRVAINKGRVMSNTSIIVDPLPTCVEIKDCESCVTSNVSFYCGWCETSQRCSDGLDRYRQDWVDKSCHTTNIHKASQCNVFIYSTPAKNDDATMATAPPGDEAAGTAEALVMPDQ